MLRSRTTTRLFCQGLPSLARELPLSIILAILTLLLYAPVARFEFINMDDDEYVFANPHVSTGLNSENIVWAFGSDNRCNWHPLTWLSHMSDCQILGVNPGPQHVVNAVLHAANAVLLFLLMSRMTGFRWRSFVVAALFACHPLHVESVAWIAERKDVLSTLFYFLSIFAYRSYVENKSLLRYTAVVVFFTCGLMAKPMTVTLPCVCSCSIIGR